jgi:hypothetical protein
MKRAQAMNLGILESWRVTTAEIAAKLGMNVARSWCKHLVEQPSISHTHSAQTDYN